MREYLNSAVFDLKKSSIREFSNLAKQTPGCISLTLGEPDFNTPDEVKKEVNGSLDRNETHYIANSGTMELRKEIARYENEHHGVNYLPEEIIVTAGATEALFVSLISIIEPGDEVIIPIPAFVLYEQIVRLCRGIPVFLDTEKEGFQISEEKLKSIVTKKTKAIILNSPNNPTGCVLNKKSIDAVGNLAKERNIFIISDDVYREIVFSDDYLNIEKYEDVREKCIHIQSFSKTYAMTGWRMGYLMADKSLIDRLELVHQFMMASTPAPFQTACVKALSCSPEEMVRVYQERKKVVLDALKNMGLEFCEPKGAFYVFPSIAELKISSEEFCRRLIIENKVAVTPGFCFGKEGYIRISFCCSDENLKEGLSRLAKFVEKRRNEIS